MPDDLPSGAPALSLRFSYAGLAVSLVEAQVIEDASLQSDDLDGLGDEPGFWYELRDVFDKVVWRHGAPHPIWFESEGPADDDGTMTWTTDPAPTGVFYAQIPLVAGAVTLAMVGSPPPGADPGPVTDLAVFGLGGIV